MPHLQEIFTSESLQGLYFVQSTAPSRQNFIMLLQELPLSNIKKKCSLHQNLVYQGFILCNKWHQKDKILFWYCRNFLKATFKKMQPCTYFGLK